MLDIRFDSLLIYGRMQARQQLIRYLARAHRTQRGLAQALGITDAFLSQILHGRRRPGLPTAARIERVTGIPTRDWATSARGAASADSSGTAT